MLSSRSVSSSETGVRKEIKRGAVHLLPSEEWWRDTNGCLNSEISEGLQLYGQIHNLRISNSTLNMIYFWVNGSFFNDDDQDNLTEEVKTYLLTQASLLESTIYFSSAHLQSMAHATC
jgi:hypothetical protein